MILINCPIEPIENRYSIQWNLWFLEYLEKTFSGSHIKIKSIYGDSISKSDTSIGDKYFLNPIDTNIWKSSQMASVLRIIRIEKEKGENKFGVFFHDLWSPGLEQLKYVESALGISIKIFGIFHAGTWDKHDFTYQSRMYEWSRGFEMGWISIADKIFVATQFHKNLLKEFMDRNTKDSVALSSYLNKIHITFLPVEDSYNFDRIDLALKKKWIAFPHRNVPEKGQKQLEHLEKILETNMPGWSIKRTHDLTNNKKEFYDLLSQCFFSVSLASQETFGISMIESLFANCVPIVPDTLSYPEVFLDIFRYKADENDSYYSQRSLNRMVELNKMDVGYLQELLDVNRQSVITRCDSSIPSIINHIISSMTRLL